MDSELDAFRQQVAVRRILERRRALHPFEWYEPSTPTADKPLGNQLAFHQARQAVRLLVPGNGWGKSLCMAAEVHAWATHAQRWQRTPDWPIVAIWFCLQYDQFTALRDGVLTRKVFGSDVVWKDDDAHWPDGSVMFVAAADRARDWRKWQGIAVDLVCFDEQPKRSLWREMYMRRRAERKTRYIIAATATEGESWMEEELYTPWLEHHKALGLAEEKALMVNSHPWIWAWTMGGINDNPGADAADIAWYEKSKWSSAKERQVRLHGGFQHWIGDCVFDEEGMSAALAALELAERTRGPGRSGCLIAG